MALSRKDERELRAVLGSPLPKEYLQLLRSFPEPLYRQLADQGADADQPLFRDVRTVIEENREAREEDIWTEDGPWPADHLMIGAEIGGDKFSLCVSTRPARVHRLNHETGTFQRIGTLRTYLQAVRRWLRGDAPTITDALESRSKKSRKARRGDPPWLVQRRQWAAQAPDQEEKAKRTNVPTDWGDAAVFYEAGDRIVDALRCCERWAELSPDDHYPLNVKVRLLSLLVGHETGSRDNPALAGQALQVFTDLDALHAAHIATAEAALAAAEKVEGAGAAGVARADLETARRAALGRPGGGA